MLTLVGYMYAALWELFRFVFREPKTVTWGNQLSPTKACVLETAWFPPSTVNNLEKMVLINSRRPSINRTNVNSAWGSQDPKYLPGLPTHLSTNPGAPPAVRSSHSRGSRFPTVFLSNYRSSVLKYHNTGVWWACSVWTTCSPLWKDAFDVWEDFQVQLNSFDCLFMPLSFGISYLPLLPQVKGACFPV